jgi:L-ascorbate metabolism protein UlaG (beta-lactamase superfamily)
LEANDASVRITWLGHSYFLLEGAGLRVAIDPHDGGSLNLPEFRVSADYLLITHDHYDHNAVEMVEARNTVKWKRGSFKLDGRVTVRGVPSFHDKAHGELRGPNTIYVLDFHGLTIAHFGDLGHMPDNDLLSLIGRVDVALIPVGESIPLMLQRPGSWYSLFPLHLLFRCTTGPRTRRYLSTR